METYVLAEKYFIGGAQNDIMNMLSFHFVGEIINPKWLTWVSENCGKTSPLYRFVLDLVVWESRMKKAEHEYEDLEDDHLNKWNESLQDVLANREISVKFFWKCMGLDLRKAECPLDSRSNYYVDG